MSDPSPLPPALDDLHWLSGLARQLIRDADLAEDAVQETLVAYLTRAPRSLRHPRAWLATVLRTRARDLVRGERRRRQRELEAARPEGGGRAADELLAELGRQRRLVELVEELDEPYRRTVLLRFLRGKSARAIARAEGVAVKTVHSRLQRALVRLRERLDREHGGDRASWALALAPLARRGAGGPFLGALGAANLLVTMNVKLAAGAAVLLSLLVGLPLALRVRGGSETRPLERRPAPMGAPDLPGLAGAAVPEAGPGRSALAEANPATAATPVAPPVAPALRELAGTVRTPEGAPVAGVRPVLEALGPGRVFVAVGGVEAERSAPDGSFRVLVPEPLPDVARVTLDDPHWTTVARPTVTPDHAGSAPLLVVASAARELAGRVIDRSGAPVPDALVEATKAGSFLQAIGVAGEVAHLLLPLAETRTDARGGFRIEAVGHLPGLVLRAGHDGYRVAELDPGPFTRLDLELVLDRKEPKGRVVFGEVRDADDLPVVGATVAAGYRSVRSGTGGGFALPLDWIEDGQQALLRAWRRGVGIAVQPFVPAATGPGSDAADPIVLRLTGGGLELAGRLVDAAGAPVPGAAVWTPDTTAFGNMGRMEGGTTFVGTTTVESLLAGGPRGMERDFEVRATTDDGGRFVLRGLQDRAYPLFALDPRTLAGAGPVLARPGTGRSELRLERATPRRVAGRIESGDGRPLSGVRVSVGRALEWTRPHRSPDPWHGSPMRPPGAARRFEARATTDAEGRFDLGSIVLEGTTLGFQSAELFLPPPLSPSAAPDPGALEVVLGVRSTFRLRLRDPGEANGYRLRTPDDRHVNLFVRVGAGVISTPEDQLVDGRSGVAFSHAAPAVDVVLTRDGVEVRRVQVELPPGGVHAIDL